MIFFDALSSFASAAISSSDGHTLGFGSGKCRRGRLLDRIAQGDVSGQGDHRDAAPRERGLHGDLQDAGHLLGLGHQLAVVAALGEEMLRMGLLEVSAADLAAGNLRGDGEDRHTAAVAVVESVDQVQVAGTAAAGADRQSPGEMRLRARGKRGRLLVSHVDPSHVLVSADRVRDSVERVARHPIDPLDSPGDERVHEHVRDVLLRHGTRRSLSGCRVKIRNN